MYPVHPNEVGRLEALRDLDVFDSPPEPRFDALCRTAQALFGVPIALVSLVGETEQRFKGQCGLALSGSPRAVSFCTYAILSDGVMVVEDATRDARFAVNPLVTGEPQIRFYAGAPLVLAPGLHLGSLCVIDRVPRTFTVEQQSQLRNLAEIAVTLLRMGRAEREARESAALYRLLADNATDVIVRCDRDGRRRYVSPAAKRLLGFEPEELLGTKPIDFVHPHDAAAFAHLLHQVGCGQIEQAVSQQRYRRKDGSWVWVEVSFNRTYDPALGAPDGYVAVIRDIALRKEAERQMAHMARQDPLTGLPNRLHFREQLACAIARTQRGGDGFALFCLDLDRFKPVNDTLGHQAGDSLLCAVAQRLKGVLRAEDLVARLGGDEFVIIQTGQGNVAESVALAVCLLAAIAAPVDLDGYPASIGLSIGIARAPDDGLDADRLFSRADQALYRAKAAHRGGYHLYGSEAAGPASADQGQALGPTTDRARPARSGPGLLGALFSGLLASSTDCVTLVDPGGHLLFMSAGNRTVMEIADIEPLLGRSWLDFWHGADREAARNALATVRAGDGASFRGFCPTPSGQPKWWAVNLSPLPGDRSGPARILAVSRDITAQVALEADLQTTARRYQALIEATGAMVWRADAAGGLVEISGWAAYTGQDPDASLGLGWLEAVHPDDQEAVTATWHATRATAQAGMATYRVRHGQDRYRWVLGRTVPLKDEAGQVREWVGTITDIHERHEAAETIRVQEERYRLAVRATQDGIWDWDVASDDVSWIKSTGEVLTYTDDASKPSRSRWGARIHPEDRARVLTGFAAAVEGTDDRWQAAYRYRGDDGVYTEVIDQAFVVRDAGGRPIRMVGAVRDMTEQRQALSALRASEERLRLALRAGRMVAWEHNLTTGRSTRSENAPQILGLPAPWQSEFLDLVHPDDRAPMADFIRSGEARAEHEFRYVSPAGRLQWLCSSVERVDADRIVGITFDVTERKLAQEKLWRTANLDALTGLPNRQLFRGRIEAAFSEAERDGTCVSLLLIDLDRLRALNDTLGHDVGDAVICAVADRLRDGLRPCDTLARLTGDEFALILVEPLLLSHAVQHAETLIERLRQPLRIRDHTLTCQASVGVAAYPDHHADWRELLKDADLALTQAKLRGRDRVVAFSPSMRVDALRRLRIAAEVRAALAAGQIVPYYQPKVCITTGRIVGFEALARWRHPERGLLTPGYFGSAFEDPELSTAIGDTILETAAADMRSWNEQDLPFGRVAVNFASAEFRKPDLAGLILDILNRFGIPAPQFEVEITETVFLGHGAETLPATLARLHERGISIALDDFGTGFGSLTHLKQFPVNHIKVDRSFVRDLDQDADSAAIVAAVIGLGRNLGMTVTAEGVETVGQAQHLAAMGCDYAQGYLYAEPMAGARVPWLLNTWQPDAFVGEHLSARSAQGLGHSAEINFLVCSRDC
ncbi:diguanylate cyclase [Methylobacterium sp. AMS5]|uniref:diguanylate cyclase domain-containing protein n=1 Tax=Methylobacterium sp. AMS5 TaxID=925818 RepID=UPI00074F968E|nr:diguanylate cyclase [Methylobacterium sp. AMS5]AMB43389.1 diguanylate cyclase [Methylobacterium sp. AMS5]